MEEMKQIDPKAVEWFDDKPVSEWSKSYFEISPKCDILLNNGCETFNNVIKPSRVKGILCLLEWIHEYCMKRMQKNRDMANDRWKSRICPKIRKLVHKYSELAGNFVGIRVNGLVYKVELSKEHGYIVDLGKRTCACRRWELTGIPCAHAINAINNRVCIQ